MERVTFTVAEVAEATGLSAMTVRRHCESGRLRSALVGGRRLIRREDLEAFIESWFAAA